MKSGIAPECKDKMLINDNFVYNSCYMFDHNYSNENTKSKYKILGSYCIFGNIKDRPWIMCYGGSTTSAIQGSTWCAELQENLKNEGINACIFNGGCASHNSWNELNKMIRDLPTLKPDKIISYSGINDFTIHVDSENPYVNIRCIEDVMELALFKGLNVPATSQDHADVFIERSNQMNAICDLHSVSFKRILQPTLGYGNYVYDMSDPKVRFLDGIARGDDVYHAVEKLNTFYDKIRNHYIHNCADYFVDLTKILDVNSRLFKDI